MQKYSASFGLCCQNLPFKQKLQNFVKIRWHADINTAKLIISALTLSQTKKILDSSKLGEFADDI